MPVLSSETGARCECREGKGEISGKCENIFTQRGCSGSGILLPENFLLNSPETDLCPPQFSCKPSKTCAGYAKTVEEIKNTATNKSKQANVRFMKSLVCNQGAKSICCPDFEPKSFLTAPVLLASLKSASQVSCSANPCPTGRWPWVGQDGLAGCVEATEDVKECETVLELFEGQLACAEFDVRITATKRNCGRRRRFSNGRCVRIY